jgi:hypothetical protein
MGCLCSKKEETESFVYDPEKQQVFRSASIHLTNPTILTHQTIVSQQYFKKYVKKYTEQDAYTQILSDGSNGS